MQRTAPLLLVLSCLLACGVDATLTGPSRAPDAPDDAPEREAKPIAPNDEAELDAPRPAAPLFRTDALSALDVEDRAYVVGHAFAVHAYSKTLPRYIEGTGFVYVPGASSEEARVVYAFAEVVDDEAAEQSACVVVEGGNVCPPDETDPLQDGEDIDDRVEPDGEVDADEDDDGDDGADGDGDGDNAPEIPTPEDPYIDDDCETFLDPAAMEARAMLDDVDPRSVLLSAGFTVDQLERALPRYDQGRSDALALEDLDEDTDHSEPETMKPFMRDAEICEHSPLVLDLDDNGVRAGSPADGVLFDLKETGALVRTAWPMGGDALLAFDRDGDGVISNGGELFGNSRMLFDERRANGFAALAELDDDGDGDVDAHDAAFPRLRLWRDLDRDGVSDHGELAPLHAYGVTWLSTTFTTHAQQQKDADGNDISMRGSFRRATPRGTVDGVMIDVWFRVQSAASPISRR